MPGFSTLCALGLPIKPSQGTRGTVATVSQLVQLSDQLNEALAQFRANSKAGVALEGADRQVPAGAVR